MKHIVYVIGHRSSDPFRIRNLLLTTKWLVSLKHLLENESLDQVKTRKLMLSSKWLVSLKHCSDEIKLTILVVEQDSKPTVNNILNKHVTYLFAYNPGFYNRGWAFNIGFKHCEDADYFYFADNDIIMDSCDMISVFKHCFKYDAVNPYNIIYDTKSELFEHKNMCYDFCINELEKNHQVKEKREHTCFTGGIVGISKKSMCELGGWDERFRGRGWEDYAFTAKINLFLKNIHTFCFSALHLWHPWEIHTDKKKNHSLNQEYYCYKVDDYINMIYDNIDKIGCINKYINECHETKYISNEKCPTILYQSCNHCGKNKCEKYHKHKYSCGYHVYDKLYKLVKYKHHYISDKQICELIYFNLCDQHCCNDHDIEYHENDRHKHSSDKSKHVHYSDNECHKKRHSEKGCLKHDSNKSNHKKYYSDKSYYAHHSGNDCHKKCRSYKSHSGHDSGKGHKKCRSYKSHSGHDSGKGHKKCRSYKSHSSHDSGKGHKKCRSYKSHSSHDSGKGHKKCHKNNHSEKSCHMYHSGNDCQKKCYSGDD